MKFGLMFFASNEEALRGDKYSLVLDCARFADTHDFAAVWVPERHFTPFGCLYPNPAVLQAALAVATERIALRAGSVVLPLHDPIRIAEEWAMVDNLSRGRVGLSLASGWNPDDFAFFPERYANRQREMFEAIPRLKRLWRGERVRITNGVGEPAHIKIYPTPVQPELPIWVTAAGDPRTFARAGAIGAHVLTHILDQDAAVLAEKIALYRAARQEHGHDPAAGHVTVMLHTFVGEDADLVREQARKPYCDYIKNNIGLLKGLARSRGHEVDLSSMSAADLEDFVGFLYERFASTRGLIGTPESCLDLVRTLDGHGVDEIACLLDFGPESELILANLPSLYRLQQSYAQQAPPQRQPPFPGAGHPPALAAPTQAMERGALPIEAPFDAESIRERCSRHMSGADFRRKLRGHGIHLESAFAGVQELWCGAGEALARVEPPSSTESVHDFGIHPAFLDACGQAFGGILLKNEEDAEDEGNQTVYLPFAVGGLKIHRVPTTPVWSHAVLCKNPAGSPGEAEGSVRVYDDRNRICIEIEGLRLREMPRTFFENSGRRPVDWLYEPRWKPLPPPFKEARHELEKNSLLLLADRGGFAEALARKLETRGGACRLVYHDAKGTPSTTDQNRFAEILAGDESYRDVVFLWALDARSMDGSTTETLAEDQDRITAAALELMRALAGTGGEPPPRLWLVTRGARATGTEKALLSPAQAPLWGLGQVFAVEHPRHWGGLVDLDPDQALAESTDPLLGCLGSRPREALVFRSNRPHGARLTRFDFQRENRMPISLSNQGCYLITGGFGGLGPRLAEELVDRGARFLILAGRSEPSADTAATIHGLETRGVRVTQVRVDVADNRQVADLLGGISSDHPPLKGIFHLAGLLEDGLLVSQNRQRLRRVSAAKVLGAWNLHLHSPHLELEHFVLFSSAAVLLPIPGQGIYAAANMFLDELALYRRQRNLPALCIDWGPWTEVGHATTEYGRTAHRNLAALGIRGLPPGEGMDVLGRLLHKAPARLAAPRVDWDQLFRMDPEMARVPLFYEVAGTAQDESESPSGTTVFLRELASIPSADRKSFVLDHLTSRVAAVLRIKDRGALQPDQRLFDLGLDSIMALDLKNRLERELVHPFSATLLFKYPNLEALTTFLVTEVLPQKLESSEETASATSLEAKPSDSDTPAAEPHAAALDALSEDEMLRLLVEEINTPKVK